MHAVGVVPGVRTGRIQKPPTNRPGAQPKPPAQAPKLKPKLGQWVRMTYDKATDLDCAVTYTFRYGRTFDEVGSDEIVQFLLQCGQCLHGIDLRQSVLGNPRRKCGKKRVPL